MDSCQADVTFQKKNGKMRPLGLPTWSDKLLQEVIRTILDAYYESQFSDRSHGFRPKSRMPHSTSTNSPELAKRTKWFIEGDISACFDEIDHSILIEILAERIHDQRFLRLVKNLLDAGYLEDWKFNQTYSGVPQGGVVSPDHFRIFVLDRLDKFVETELIPKTHQWFSPKIVCTVRKLHAVKSVHRARQKRRLWKLARKHVLAGQKLPSYDPQDPNFRRLWYVRYADDFLLGYVGPKADAVKIKQQIAAYLRANN